MIGIILSRLKGAYPFSFKLTSSLLAIFLLLPTVRYGAEVSEVIVISYAN